MFWYKESFDTWRFLNTEIVGFVRRVGPPSPCYLYKTINVALKNIKSITDNGLPPSYNSSWMVLSHEMEKTLQEINNRDDTL